MKKEILLLEDKITRDSLNIDTIKNLEQTTSLKVVLGENDCNNLLDEFMEGSEIFTQYTTIIIHASIYKSEKREQLFDKLSNIKDKNIVIFSGDTSFSHIDNCLKLSAESLYGGNLEIFLNEPNGDLLVLVFGKNWKVNVLLNTLEKLNLFIEQDSEKLFDFDDFEEEIDLLELKNIMTDNNYNSFISRLTYEDKINREQIILIQQKIDSRIKELSE